MAVCVKNIRKGQKLDSFIFLYVCTGLKMT